MARVIIIMLTLMSLVNIGYSAEQIIVTKASETEATLTTTVVTEQTIPLKQLKDQKAIFEARKVQLNEQLDTQIAKLDKAIKDAEVAGVVEEVAEPKVEG